MTTYFTEIEEYQNKIKNLLQKLEQEREEHKELYMKLKSENEYMFEIVKEVQFLRDENKKLKTELESIYNIENA